MKKLEMAKNGLGLVVGLGVTSIVSNVIKNNTSEEGGALNKVCTAVAGMVLVGMVTDRAMTYFNEKFDKSVKAIEEADEESKEIETV